MAKLTHSDLIKLGTLLGYTSLNKGLCQGFSCMWAQALLAQDEEHFFNRLELIASYHPDFEALISALKEAKKKARQLSKLTQNDIDLLEILAFFDGIQMYLNPWNHLDLFDRNYVYQSDLNTIYPFSKSKKMGESDLSILLDKSHIFSKASLTAFLQDLEELLKNAAIECPILLDNAGHSVCLKYCKTKQKWFYIDTNDFRRYPGNATYFRELETTELVSSLFQSLSDSSAANVLFNMKVLATTSQTQELEPIKVSLAMLASRYPVTPEVATLCDNRKLSLLFLACQLGDLNLLQIVLKHPEININQANTDGATPLFIACQNGHSAVVAELLKQPGLLINQTRQDETTPLYIACAYGHLDVVIELLKQPELLINQTREDKKTPLYVACTHGHLGIVIELLKQPGLLINQTGQDEKTPLYVACTHGHLGIVIELLKQPGLLINQTGQDEKTPLYIACTYGHLDVVIELLKQPGLLINQTGPDEKTPLYVACTHGYLGIVIELLKQPGLLINQETSEELTPLHIACNNGHHSVVAELLKKHNILINKAKKNGVTALYMACQCNQLAVVELLLKTPGIDINSRGLANHSPLLVSCVSPHTKNNEKLFQLLLENNASLNHKNDEGQTALDIAFEQENTAALSVLLKFMFERSMTPSALMSLSSLEKALGFAKAQCPEVAEYLTTYQSREQSIRFFDPPPLTNSSPPNDESLAPRNGG